MRLAASLGLAGLLLLTGCAPSALERPVVTEYGEFCGPGRPDLGGGTADEQIQRMRQIRPRDAIDAICRDHDLCVMRANNDVLDVECSRRMRRALTELTSSGNPLTPRCHALAGNFQAFFMVPDGQPPATDLERRMAQPVHLLDQALNGLNTVPLMLPRLISGWPDRFEPCFGLTAGRPGPDWEIPLAAPLGRAQPRIDGTWMVRRIPGGRVVFHPAWRPEPQQRDGMITMMRDLPGGTVTVQLLFREAQGLSFPVPPAPLASGLANLARHDVQAGAGEAVLLDVAQVGVQHMVRYLFDGAAHDGRHRLAFGASLPGSGGGGPVMVAIYGFVPVATGPNGLLAIEEIAAGLRWP